MYTGNIFFYDYNMDTLLGMRAIALLQVLGYLGCGAVYNIHRRGYQIVSERVLNQDYRAFRTKQH